MSGVGRAGLDTVYGVSYGLIFTRHADSLDISNKIMLLSYVNVTIVK